MRILQLTWSRMDAYGGIQSCVRTLQSALVDAGCPVFTWGLPWGGPTNRGRSPCLPASGFAAALDTLIDDCRIEAVISHNLHVSYGPGVSEAVARCARLRNLPHVIVVHDLGPIDSNRAAANALRDHVCSEILKGAHVSVTSDFNFGAFSRYFREPDAIVPPGIDFRDFTPDGEPDLSTIAVPGRITPEKGALRAIDMLAALAHDIGPLQVLLSARERHCTGESEAYFNAIDDKAARYPQLSIHFLAGADPVQRMYRRATVTLVLSEDEGFCLVPLESLACHCPAVAHLVGGMTWLRGVPGAFCIENSGDAYEAVRQVLMNLGSWRAEAVRAREELQHKYDIRTVARRHLAALASRRVSSACVIAHASCGEFAAL